MSAPAPAPRRRGPRKQTALDMLVDAMTEARVSGRPVEVDFTHCEGDRFVMVLRYVGRDS